MTAEKRSDLLNGRYRSPLLTDPQVRLEPGALVVPGAGDGRHIAQQICSPPTLP